MTTMHTGAAHRAADKPGRTRLGWDLFVKVIDNWGDIGVCWRLARELAQQGHRVRLWVDEPGALAWMASPGGEDEGLAIDVRPWAEADAAGTDRVDVVIEAFACDPPAAYLAAFAALANQRQAAGQRAPAWINLEYLSAEAYVQRSHGLPSPQSGGPAAGLTKHFFYPGFTRGTGGVLRCAPRGERGATPLPLTPQPQRRERLRELTRASAPWPSEAPVISLFCYEPTALAGLLAQGLGGRPVVLLVAAGRTSEATRAALARAPAATGLHLHAMPLLPQTAFDEVLRLCDFNFVRGEDSWVSALRAGQPFLWQAYEQHDHAHHAKVGAFLTWAAAAGFGDPDWQLAMRTWNGMGDPGGAMGFDLARAWQPTWASGAARLRDTLAGQPDLVSALEGFVAAHSVYN